MGFVGCDGGCKDETSAPKNVLSDNWATEGTLVRSMQTKTTAHTALAACLKIRSNDKKHTA